MNRLSRLALAAFATTLLGVLAACGPIKLIATADIPRPLIAKLPFAVALYVPSEFSTYVHEEERWSTEWHIDLGKAQTEGITRLLTSMFDKVVTVDSLNAGAGLGSDIRAILEPSIEEYAFVTPRDAGSTPFFAVSIRYRVNVYTPEGKLADSWGFTGYGTSPSQGLSSVKPLARATSLAMRDAGAKLAAEFHEQPVVRGLIPVPESGEGPGEVVPLPGTQAAEDVSAQETSGEHAAAGDAATIEAPAEGGAATEDASTEDRATEATTEGTAPTESTGPAGEMGAGEIGDGATDEPVETHGTEAVEDGTEEAEDAGEAPAEAPAPETQALVRVPLRPFAALTAS